MSTCLILKLEKKQKYTSSSIGYIAVYKYSVCILVDESQLFPHLLEPIATTKILYFTHNNNIVLMFR